MNVSLNRFSSFFNHLSSMNAIPEQRFIKVDPLSPPKVVVARFPPDGVVQLAYLSPGDAEEVQGICPVHLGYFLSFVSVVCSSNFTREKNTISLSSYRLTSLNDLDRVQLIRLLGCVEYLINFISPKKSNGIVYYFCLDGSDSLEGLLRRSRNHILFLLLPVV